MPTNILNAGGSCLACVNSGGSGTTACSWTGYLAAGDVIRPHVTAGGGYSVSNTANEIFTIQRVA